MLTLRCTAKMLKKLKCKANPNPSASDNALGDWFGNLFLIGRKEYFLFTNARSLISVVTSAAPQIPLNEFVPYLYEMLTEYGVPEERVQEELKAMSPISLAKTNDRSVLASMNVFVKEVQDNAVIYGAGYDPTLLETRFELCEIPLNVLNHSIPVDAAMNILEGRDPLEQRKGERRVLPGGFDTFDDDDGFMSGAAPALTVMRPDGSSQRYAVPAPSDPATRQAVRDLVAEAAGSEEPPIFTLRDVVDATGDPGGDLAWLVVRDPEERVFMHAVILLFTATGIEPVPEDVTALVQGGAIPVLEKAMRDPEVPDSRKLVAGPLLARLGAEIPDDEYTSCFEDFEAAQADWSSKMPPVSATPDCAARFLESAALPMETEACRVDADDGCWPTIAGVVAHAAARDPGAAALMLCAASASAVWQEHKDVEALRMALEQFSAADSPEALWQLEAFARWPYAGTLGDVAGHAAKEMRTRGVTPRHAFEPEFSHGYLSMSDGAGARQLALFYRTPEGGMDSILCLPKDSWGLKDSFPTFGDSAQIEEIFRRQGDQIVHAPCTPKLGREIVADAMALSLETGRRIPPNAFLCLQYLGSEPLVPKRREPNLGAYMLEAMRRTPDMAADSAELMDTVPFGGLWFAGDGAYDFVEAKLTGRKRKLPKKAFEEYVRDVCVLERDDLLRRMAVNLEVESLAGRATRPENKVAARTYLALAEEVAPFHEISYVRMLAEHSVQVIRENLKMGYRGQDDANQAALDMDESMMDMFQEILGPFGPR